MTTNEKTAAVGPVGEEALRDVIAALDAADIQECHVNGDKADVISAPTGSNYIPDQRTVARCATGPLWVKQAVAIAKAINFVRNLAQSHPTTVQQTVATPRDGGVREALVAKLRLASSGQMTAIGQHTLSSSAMDEAAEFIAAISAPGSAGPGEDDTHTRTGSMLTAYAALENALRQFGATHEYYGARPGLAFERAERKARELLTTVQPNTGETGDGWLPIADAPEATPVEVMVRTDHVIGVHERRGTLWWTPGLGAYITRYLTHYRLCSATPATNAETPGPADPEGGR